jgi:hypothetical protein
MSRGNINNPAAKTIYADELVDVYDEGIRLKRYYFPTARPKFVKFTDIDRWEIKPSSLRNGKWRNWGTGDFKTWFPLDLHRSKRDVIFFIRLTTQKTAIGFSVENCDAFMKALTSKSIEIINGH